MATPTPKAARSEPESVLARALGGTCCVEAAQPIPEAADHCRAHRNASQRDAADSGARSETIVE